MWGFMDSRFVVIDGRRVLAGSLEWTNDALRTHDAELLILRSPKAVAEYEAEFQEFWGGTFGR
jgi:phosphatidylserine/phosphatidylglycerophosphate/cardiolipin synthase-like enzyme